MLTLGFKIILHYQFCSLVWFKSDSAFLRDFPPRTEGVVCCTDFFCPSTVTWKGMSSHITTSSNQLLAPWLFLLICVPCCPAVTSFPPVTGRVGLHANEQLTVLLSTGCQLQLTADDSLSCEDADHRCATAGPHQCGQKQHQHPCFECSCFFLSSTWAWIPVLLSTTTWLLLVIHDSAVSYRNHPDAVDGPTISEGVEVHNFSRIKSFLLRFVPSHREGVLRGSAVGCICAHRCRVVRLLLQSESKGGGRSTMQSQDWNHTWRCTCRDHRWDEDDFKGKCFHYRAQLVSQCNFRIVSENQCVGVTSSLTFAPLASLTSALFLWKHWK